jgi:hypothetical protein
LSIWDCPGFADTEGIDQELLNAYYISSLLENVQKAKFVFVTSLGSINIQGGRPLIDNLTNFADSFKDISFLEGKISICVTQVDDYLNLE